MVRDLWSSIYRERRRLAFVTALAFVAGVLFYVRADIYIHGVHVSLVVGAIYAAVVGIAALLVCLFLPNFRFMIEAVAVSRLIFSLFVLVQPEIGYKILAMPALNASLVVFGGVLISRAMHGRILREKASGWRDRLIPRNAFHRTPTRVKATPLQFRFVSWVDGGAPIAADHALGT